MNKLESLQILRAYAALLIVIYHAIYDVSALYFGEEKKLINNPELLIYGIDLFFVISGFIMVYTTFSQSGFEVSKKFIIRRLIRIVPLYWFYTFLLLAVVLVLPSAVGGVSFSLSEFIKSLFFIPYFDSNDRLFPFLKLGWTLNYEMYFYLVFAVLLLLPFRILLPALIAFFSGLYFFQDALLPEGIIQAFYGKRIVLNFMIGVVIGYAFKRGLRLPSWSFWLGVLVVFMSFFCIIFYEQIISISEFRFNRMRWAALTVALFVLAKNWEAVSMPKPLVILGDASYSLYLSHVFVIGGLTALIGLIGIQGFVPVWVMFFSAIALSITGGVLSYLYLEKPMLALSKRLIAK
ncbi:MAG: acyltransferase [Pseudomonadota bacterium]